MDQTRTIERSRDDRVLFGVCGGVARAFAIDPTVVRVVAVVLVALGGVGLVAYVVAALLLPEEGGGRPVIDLGVDQRDRTKAVVAILVLAAVVLLLAGDPFPNADRGGLIVAVAVGVAIWLLVRDRRRSAGESTAPTTAVAPAAGDATTAVAPPRAADTRPLDPDGRAPEGDEPPAAPAPRRRRAEAAAWGLVLLGLAVGAAVLQAVSDDPAWDLYAAGAVVLVGVVLLVTAPFGGAPGLVVCGFLLAGGVGVAAASDVSLRGGAGDRVHRPAETTDLREAYRLGAGSMTLDLSALDLPPGTTTIEADLGFGELLVDVPADADVEVSASASGGEVVLFGERSDGLGVDASRVSEGDGDARLVLDLHVGFGHVDVERAEP